MEITPAFPKARRSLPTLEAVNNYYVVPLRGSFHYFPIKVDASDLNNSDKKFIRLIKSPPVLIDGYLISNKRAFEISSDDILRGRVCKCKEIPLEISNDSTTSNSPTDGSASSPVFTHPNQLGSIDGVELEVSEAADAAWSEQVGTLLHSLSSQEGGEWVVEETAQS